MTEEAQDGIGAQVDRFFWATAAVILAIGFVFRLPGLSSRSFWIDELYSEWFSSRSFAELWRDVPFYEPHPPVYYTLLKLWTFAFGNSELGLRSLSLIASMATILVVAVSGRLMRAGVTGTVSTASGERNFACLLKPAADSSWVLTAARLLN